MYIRSYQRGQYLRQAKNKRGVRGSGGYMTAICAGLLGAIIFLGMAGLSFYQLFLSSASLQGDADRFALMAALKLNENDTAGKINLLEHSSRELIHDSRESYESLRTDGKQPDSLAAQLLEEAKQGHSLVEQSRQAWITCNIVDLKKLSKRAGSGELFTSAIALPWSAAKNPEVVSVEFGNLTESFANVEAAKGSESLIDFDMSKGYLDPTNRYYLGNRSLSLPSDDGKMQFHLSCLPPPIQGEVAEARLAENARFKSSVKVLENGAESGNRPPEIPCAVRVVLRMQVEGHIGKGLRAVEEARAVAMARGAGKPLD